MFMGTFSNQLSPGLKDSIKQENGSKQDTFLSRKINHSLLLLPHLNGDAGDANTHPSAKTTKTRQYKNNTPTCHCVTGHRQKCTDGAQVNMET